MTHFWLLMNFWLLPLPHFLLLLKFWLLGDFVWLPHFWLLGNCAAPETGIFLTLLAPWDTICLSVLSRATTYSPFATVACSQNRVRIWNKNTKCPIDAHCHHHCRRDLRIREGLQVQELSKSWHYQDCLDPHLIIGRDYHQFTSAAAYYETCKIICDILHGCTFFKIIAWFLQCMTVFKFLQISFLHLITSSILWSSLQLFVSLQS